MQRIDFTTAQKELPKVIDQVCSDNEAVLITRNGEVSAVMISLEEYESLTETDFLLRSSTNKKRLTSAIASLNKKAELHEQSARFTRIGNRAVKKAQEESRRLGVPNVYMHNGKIFYEKPDGEITTEDLFAPAEK